jgi:hypothetical protein
MLKKSNVPGAPMSTSRSNEQIDELVRIWEDDGLSVDDKLAATFRGLEHALDPPLDLPPKPPSPKKV